jgi:YebC/PmpR family DNA-binding regulatory protein
MSRHSKWSKIKHQKGAEDQKRGVIFTKLAKLITLAAKEGGPDPKMNFKLRLAIEEAKGENLPKENIERAIEKGVGGKEGEQIEEVLYEGFLPGGVAIIIESLTNNRNRTSGEIKHFLLKHGGSLGAQNSVSWMFKRVGAIKIGKSGALNKDDFELQLIENGAEEIIREDDELVVLTKSEDLQKMRAWLEGKGLTIKYAGLEWEAKEKIKAEDRALREKLENIFEEMEESEEINNYFTNLE